MISGILNYIDIYGHVIGVHYKGNGTYTTRLGGLLTLVTFTLICINGVGLFTQFADHSN